MSASASENRSEGVRELLSRVPVPTLPTHPVADSMEREEVIVLTHGPFYLLGRELHRGRDVVLFTAHPECPSLCLAPREPSVILIQSLPLMQSQDCSHFTGENSEADRAEGLARGHMAG